MKILVLRPMSGVVTVVSQVGDLHGPLTTTKKSAQYVDTRRAVPSKEVITVKG
jgi:hypothetical protein